MKNNWNTGLVGIGLIGLGCGLAAMGVALVIPACASFSLGVMGRALGKSREGIETAAATFGEFAGRAQHRFDEAAKLARQTTAKAAGAVESAARQVREYAS
jgi:hypothetical protein